MSEQAGLRAEITNGEAVLVNMNPRAEKNGEEFKPACDLNFQISLPNDFLSFFAPELKDSLFKKGDQGQLIEGHRPVMRFPKMSGFGWNGTMVGKLTVSIGVGKPMIFTECKIHKFRFEPQEGGTVITRFQVQTHANPNDVAKLYEYQRQKLTISIEPQEEADNNENPNRNGEDE